MEIKKYTHTNRHCLFSGSARIKLGWNGAPGGGWKRTNVISTKNGDGKRSDLLCNIEPTASGKWPLIRSRSVQIDVRFTPWTAASMWGLFFPSYKDEKTSSLSKNNADSLRELLQWGFFASSKELGDSWSKTKRKNWYAPGLKQPSSSFGVVPYPVK